MIIFASILEQIDKLVEPGKCLLNSNTTYLDTAKLRRYSNLSQTEKTKVMN